MARSDTRRGPMSLSIDEARRAAMYTLETSVGGPRRAAEHCGIHISHWCKLRKGLPYTATGELSGMYSKTARRIESAFGKPSGWLDIAHLVDLSYRKRADAEEHDQDLGRVLEAWWRGGRSLRTILLNVSIMGLELMAKEEQAPTAEGEQAPTAEGEQAPVEAREATPLIEHKKPHRPLVAPTAEGEQAPVEAQEATPPIEHKKPHLRPLVAPPNRNQHPSMDF